MLMSDKLKAMKSKNSKKAFTLVELVIVIAVLAILAAIAVPVITSMLNSAKLSTMKSNSTTVDVVLKEAVNSYKVDLTTEYNSQPVSRATVKDVLLQNGVKLDIMEVQKIDGIEYAIYWDKDEQSVSIHSDESLEPYNLDLKISEITDY